MESYIQFVYNLAGTTKFDRFRANAKSVITSQYVQELNNFNALERAIKDVSSKEVLKFVSESIDLKLYFKNIILTTDTTSYVDETDVDNVKAVVNLRKVNHIRFPNELFQQVNAFLPTGGVYIGRFESYWERKNSFYKKAGPYLGEALWLVDFVLNRVIPRIPYLDKIYYKLTNGDFRAMSKAEVLGRLVYCGFKIMDYRVIDNLSYFVVKKTGKPSRKQTPSFYPIIGLDRIGKNGKSIRVYKFRTMHPYSEFLQDYVIHINGYNQKGKPHNDFRVARWGKLFRKLWIDELPQLINVFKGEMKLVGLRPLSKVRFCELPEDLRNERLNYKPGCFPPYVALKMLDAVGNVEAERIYINDLKKHPLTTDIRYFFKCLKSILLDKVRSA